MLEHEISISRTNENTTVLHKLQESGIKLFYYLIDCYTEEASLCPPTKQLITTCLEKLGQVGIIELHINNFIEYILIQIFQQSFINGEESQAPQLLNTIIQKQNLGGLLGPYFTPVAGGASALLQMYQTVVELSTGTNVDLCFVLLSKVR